MKRHWPIFFALGLFLQGCSKAPSKPVLPHSETPRFESRIFGEKLSLDDIREIFQELNRDQKLSALKIWFEPASETDLAAILDWFNTYLFRSTELTQLVKKGIEEKRASDLESLVSTWPSSFSQGVAQILAHPQSPYLASKDAHWIAPDLDSIWDRYQKSRSAYKNMVDHGKVETDFDPHYWLHDLEALSQVPELSAWLDRFEHQLSHGNLLKAFLDSRAKLRHSESAEGLAFGLSKLLLSAPEKTLNGKTEKLTNSTQLEQLLRFGAETDSLTDGLFSVLAQQLRENPDVMQEISDKLIEHLAGLSAKAMASLAERELRERLDDAAWESFPRKEGMDATPNFSKVFLAVQRALDRVAKPSTSLDRIIVPYAVTRWLESVVANNLCLLKSYESAIWSEKLEAGLPEVHLIEWREDHYYSPYEKDFKQFKKESSVAEMIKRVESGFDSEFSFSFPSEKLTLRESLEFAFKMSIESRKLDQNQTLIRSIALAIADPDLGFPISLPELETESLFVSLNSAISFLPRPKFRSIKKFIFEEMKFGHLPEEEIESLANLYDGHPHLQKKVVNILRSIRSLEIFDEPVHAELPSGFESYHALVKQLGIESQHELGLFFQFGDKAGLFGLPEGEIKYSGLYHTLANRPTKLASTVYALGKLSRWERAKLTSKIWQSFQTEPPGILNAHWELLNSLRTESPGFVVALLDPKKSYLNFKLSPSFRSWLVEALGDEQTKEAWRAITARWSHEEWKRLAKEILARIEDGSLQRALSALEWIRDTRVQEIANLLKTALESGELAALMRALQALANASAELPSPLKVAPKAAPSFTNLLKNSPHS